MRFKKFAFAARFLKCDQQFWGIIHQGVNGYFDIGQFNGARCYIVKSTRIFQGK